MSLFRTAVAATPTFIVSPLGILNGIPYNTAMLGSITAADFYEYSKIRDGTP